MLNPMQRSNESKCQLTERNKRVTLFRSVPEYNFQIKTVSHILGPLCKSNDDPG